MKTYYLIQRRFKGNRGPWYMEDEPPTADYDEVLGTLSRLRQRDLNYDYRSAEVEVEIL